MCHPREQASSVSAWSYPRTPSGHL